MIIVENAYRSNNASDIFYYINAVLNWENVPEELIDIMIKDVYYAYYYGVYVLRGNEVPEKVLRVIESSEEYRVKYEIFKLTNV